MNTESGYGDDESEGGSLLAYLPLMISQRLKFLLIPAILFTLLGVAASFLLPKVYRSTAVLLVEAPQLPEEVAGPASSDVVDQRIAKIRQEVLSRPGLIELIRKNSLYAEERKAKPLSEVIDTMRDAVEIAPVSAQIQQRGGNRGSTIAFSMSFDYPEPAKAQVVAQDLTEQVLMLDSTRNAEQATNTVQFLSEQADDLQSQISEIERQVADIKARNGMVLSNAGITLMGGSSGSYDAQISALQRENGRLALQQTRDPMVAAAEAQLAAARSVYSETHPDVILAKQRLIEARQMAASGADRSSGDSISSQIAFNNSQIAALQAARAQESSRVSAVMNAQSRAPLIGEQIAQLQRRQDGLNTRYQAVSAKLMMAKAGEKAESEQKGERLTVIDPPVVPDKPVSPNRPKLIAGGMIVGLGLGFALIVALEMFQRPIRGVDPIRAVVGELPLVVIPTIKFDKSLKKPWFPAFWRFGSIKRLTSSAGE